MPDHARSINSPHGRSGSPFAFARATFSGRHNRETMVSEKSRSFLGICGPCDGTEASRGCHSSRNIAVISFPGAAWCGPQTNPPHPWEKYAAFTEPVKELVAHLPLADSHGNEQPPANQKP